MSAAYCLQELLPGELVEGGVVAAPFPHDQNWYRARVVGVADSTLQLLFLDFGDTASVDVAMVKTLRPRYYRQPVQAIPCRVARVKPKGQRSICGTLFMHVTKNFCDKKLSQISWILECHKSFFREI